jgi:hypothetical protein
MRISVLTLAMVAITCCAVGAVPQLALHSANQGIGSMRYEVMGTDIHIWEDWTSNQAGFVQMQGLNAAVNYTVFKHLQNNTGVDWHSFANELLDPNTSCNDFFDAPRQPWIPRGYGFSNEWDGLSFAQGRPWTSPDVPRSSSSFAAWSANEYFGHDYLDFYRGTVSGEGGTDLMSFGVRDNAPCANEAFLLAERPNTCTGGGPVIPEPATFILFGIGLAGLALRLKK